MDASTRARAFAPIPELATEAELSGLFKLLEAEDRLDSNSTTPRAVECVTPARAAVAAAAAPADRAQREFVDARDRLRGAFFRWSTAVDAELESNGPVSYLSARARQAMLDAGFDR